MKTLLFILFLAPVLLFAQDSNPVNTFKIKNKNRRVTLQNLYSKSNTLFEGENVLILKGVDTSEISNYSIKCLNQKGVRVFKNDSLFFVEVDFSNTGVSSNRPVSCLIFLISKTHGTSTVTKDTVVFNMWYNTQQKLLVMLGKKNVYENHFRKGVPSLNSVLKKNLLKFKRIYLENHDSSDYCNNFKIAGFRIKACNTIFYSHSDSITPEMISALNECPADNLELDSIFISDDNYTIPIKGVEETKVVQGGTDTERVYSLFYFLPLRIYY